MTNNSMPIQEERYGSQYNGGNEGERQKNSKKDGVGKNNKLQGEADKSKVERQRHAKQRQIGLHHGEIVEHIMYSEFEELNEKSYYRDAKFEFNDLNSTLLHRIIRDYQEKDKRLSEQALAYVEDIVLEKPEFFTYKDGFGTIPLLDAARSQTSILFLVLDLLLSDAARIALHEETKCKNDEFCSLQDVVIPAGRKRQMQPTIQTLTNEQKRMSSGTITPPPEPDTEEEKEKKLSPHWGIDVKKLLKEDEKLRNLLKEALGHVEQARALFMGLISVRNFNSTAQRIDLKGIDVLLDLCPEDVFVKPPTTGFTPLHMAVDLIDKGSLDLTTLLKFIESLVDRFPYSIFCKSTIRGQTKSLFQLLNEKFSLSSVAGWTKQAAQLEMFLKDRCIGYRELKTVNDSKDIEYDEKWSDKKELLYPDITAAKRIHLSLSGESRILDSKYIDKIKARSGMKFEIILGYVELPYWNPTTVGGSQPKKPDESPLEGGQSSEGNPDPYIGIFQWLREEKVEKIFTVDVDDDGNQPHTNAAIRQCLNGPCRDGRLRDFNIEIWKWKKFDICSETIFKAAPAAREVYLYSHGNTAVLRSWAAEGGIAKLLNLERLIVEIRPKSNNDENDCKDYKEEFESSILEYCRKLKRLYTFIVPYGFSETSATQKAGSANSNAPEARSGTRQMMPESPEWIFELEGYKDFMARLNVNLKNKLNVKVAILDDGANLDELTGSNQHGQSYHPKQDWFVGPCKHGTAMAKCVRDICPGAELIICRLDNSQLVDSKQPFTISSCTKALKYALQMGAEIVSMSWTYEIDETSTDEEKKEFEHLVGETLRNNTAILFGSHPDQGPNIELSKYAPVSLPGIIKICSATVYGAISQENTLAKADFLLPGEEIPMPGVWEDTVKGSSFATAYAAGLAALVLYSLKANQLCLEDDIDLEEAKLTLDIVRRHQGMRKVFRILAGRDSEDAGASNCFVRPNSQLKGHDADDLKDQKKHLTKTVHKIVPQKLLEAKFS